MTYEKCSKLSKSLYEGAGAPLKTKSRDESQCLRKPTEAEKLEEVCGQNSSIPASRNLQGVPARVLCVGTARSLQFLHQFGLLST